MSVVMCEWKDKAANVGNWKINTGESATEFLFSFERQLKGFWNSWSYKKFFSWKCEWHHLQTARDSFLLLDYLIQLCSPLSNPKSCSLAFFFRFLEINILNRTLLLLEHLFFRKFSFRGGDARARRGVQLSACNVTSLAHCKASSLSKALRGLWTVQTALEDEEARTRLSSLP